MSRAASLLLCRRLFRVATKRERLQRVCGCCSPSELHQSRTRCRVAAVCPARTAAVCAAHTAAAAAHVFQQVAERLDASRLHVRNFDDAEFFGNGIVNALDNATVIPEPASLLLLTGGGLTLLTRRRRA